MENVRHRSCEICGETDDPIAGPVKLEGTLMNASGSPLTTVVGSALAFPSTWTPSPEAVVCSSCYLLVAEIDFHNCQGETKSALLREKYQQSISTDCFPECLRCVGLDQDGTSQGYELKPFRHSVCRFCATTCSTPDLAVMHVATYHPEFASHTFMCFFCLAGFSNYSDLSTHVLLSHLQSDRGDETGKFTCRFLSMCRLCGAYDHSPSFVPQHFLLNHPGCDPYLCPTCGKGFSGFEDYESHLKHEGQKLLEANYSSNTWDIGWPELQDFDAAQVTKTEEAGIVGSANELFDLKPMESSGLEVEPQQSVEDVGVEAENNVPVDEEDVPEDSDAGKCPICRELVADDDMELHVKDGHRVSYIRKCEECRKWFTKQAEYRKHRSEMHLKGREKVADKCCEKCGAVFTRKRDLDSHMLTKHDIPTDGRRIFQCKECGKKFFRKNKYLAHILVHEGVKPFACTICDYRATQRGHLITHGKRRHGDRLTEIVNEYS